MALTVAVPGQTVVPTQGLAWNGQSGSAGPAGAAAKAGNAADAAAAKNGAGAAAGDSVQLSPQAAAEVAKLKSRDADVRAHEQAHLAAAGDLVRGGPNYDYQRGPDGKDYAVGGEVTIDTSPVNGNPRATITKAQRIIAAALAPADPSSQDESVAGQAQAMENQAQAQLTASQVAATSQVLGSAGRKPSGKVAPGSLVDLTG
jgi:hypothetical protein